MIPRSVLSPQELKVVKLIVKGYKYKDIAESMGLGTETVRTYVSRIRKKLGVRSKTEIATWYLKPRRKPRNK